LHLESFWNDGVATARFTPNARHVGLPGFVYGGLLASLVDCHAMATAAAASWAATGREVGEGPLVPFVTAALQVNYLKPTPQGAVLELSGTIEELAERKVRVRVSVRANGVECVNGSVVAVPLPRAMQRPGH
jgi:acyl-coenzyme A thioesterase PaaI-like protein